jgi:hypothetical protein
MVASLATIAALIGWVGLALQLWIMLGNLGLVPALWRFFGFFTILANLGAAAVATAVALGSDGPLAGARARLMAATSILMVGLVYSVALRALWNPTGLQKVADVALHDAAPLTWVVLWLFAPHTRLGWKEIWWALIPPAAYVAYAMIRGALDGWYAYWFMNPAIQTPTAFAMCIAILLGGFSLAAAALVAADRMIGKRTAAPATV